MAAQLYKKFCKDQPKSFLSLTAKEEEAAGRRENLLMNPTVRMIPRRQVILLSASTHEVNRLAAFCYKNNLTDP